MDERIDERRSRLRFGAFVGGVVTAVGGALVLLTPAIGMLRSFDVIATRQDPTPDELNPFVLMLPSLAIGLFVGALGAALLAYSLVQLARWKRLERELGAAA